MTDTEDIDYGPLGGLIGTWTGDKGMDLAPEPDGTEENPYFESIVFEAAGDVKNAESQVLAIVRYHQNVRRKYDRKVFHDQVGYWTWDAAAGTLAHSFTIPRRVCVLAGGKHSGEADADGSMTLRVSARLDDAAWSIVQSPFMLDKARTLAFEHELTVKADRIVYSQTTRLEIYGRTFDHTDTSELVRQA
ncbi:MAG: heme-binding beta-barrel domain-containing protein [Acidobacteriota bacterium]